MGQKKNENLVGALKDETVQYCNSITSGVCCYKAFKAHNIRLGEYIETVLLYQI